MYVVAVYDISLDEKGSRNWRKIFGICKCKGEYEMINRIL